MSVDFILSENRVLAVCQSFGGAPVSVYVLPGLGVGVAEKVGSVANDLAVFFMKLMHPLNPVTLEVVVLEGLDAHSSKRGAGVFGQCMEAKPVCAYRNTVKEQL